MFDTILVSTIALFGTSNLCAIAANGRWAGRRHSSQRVAQPRTAPRRAAPRRAHHLVPQLGPNRGDQALHIPLGLAGGWARHLKLGGARRGV